MQTLLETLPDGVEVHAPFDLTFDEDLQPMFPRGPRERALEEGVETLSDGDLLAIVLGTGLTGCSVMQLATGLIARCGGLEGLGRLGPGAIAEHPGVGVAKALRLAAALEAGKRAVIRAARPRAEIVTSSAVAHWFTKRLGWKDREELWSLSLDGRHGLRSARRIAEGSLHGMHLTVRDILGAGMQDAAAAVILVHNHPSGDPTPSPQDVEMTHRAVVAGYAVGLPVLDHVIVASSGRYTSMLDLGMLSFG